MARLSPATYAFFLTVILTCMPFIQAHSQELPLVNSIEVNGLKRIDTGAVKAKITQKTGEPVSDEKTAQDISSIFRMGYFDDVRIEMETFEGGVRLIYVVKEKPTIVKVEFQGNEEFDDDKMKEKTTITAGSIADITLIQDNATKLQRFYEEEGYWLAKVVPVISRTTEHEAILTYQIDEGEKVRIRKINIVGNERLSTRQIRKAIKTDEWAIYSFIFSSGYYKKEIISADIEAIKDLYLNNGFLKVAVAEPEVKLTEDRKGMTIDFRVSEGEQYNVSEVALTGNSVFPSEDLMKQIKLSGGAVFSKETIKGDITAMTDRYTQNGYALANIYPDVVPDDAAKQAKVTYKVEEGDLYRIGRIEVSGNTKTRDKVIRREVRLDEGDKFNSALLKRSYERINNLNFFESVDLVPKPRQDEKLLDIDIRVKERATGFLSVGGGYSSIDKFVVMLEVTQGNLFGTGQYVKLKGQLGGSSQFYELSYRDPWFMDKPISFTADIYNITREYVDYSKKAIGLGFSFGKNFTEYWGGSVSYKLERATVYDVAEDADNLIKDQEGTAVTSSITPSIARDTRDNYLDPSKGSRNSLYVTFAGIGGDNKFIKSVFDSAWFFPVGKTSSTIALRGRVGFATGIFGEELPVYERFYLGGINTIRGLGFGQAGPRDEDGTVMGGTKELIFNAEYIFPLVKELKLKGIVFFDAGNSWDNSIEYLRYTAGTGFRWISPMGPIRVEWGYNLQKKYPDEDTSRVEFTFGTFF